MNFKKIVTFGLVLSLIGSSVFAKAKYISPNNDGVKDELEIPLRISDKRYVQAWSLVILDENREVVRVIENKVSLPEKLGFKSFFKQLVTPKQGVPIPESVSWNGVMNNGETAPDGTYYYYVTATDDNGNTGKSKEFEVVVDTIAPQIALTQPTDKTFGEGSKIAFRVNQKGSEEDSWIAVFKSVDGTVVKTFKWENASPSEFSWYGTNEDGIQVADGVYSYDITATDRAGNVAPQTTITNIIYSADKPATNIVVEGSRYFSPNTESKQSNVLFSLTIPVPDSRTGNNLVEWEVSVEDKTGTPVRTYNQEKDGAVPPSSITFDGLNNAGTLLADGEYKVGVTARYSNGYIPAKIYSPVIVLDTNQPKAQISTTDKVFGGGAAQSAKFTIVRNPDNGAPIPTWKAEVKTADGAKTVKTYDFGEYPPETITWNGVTDKGSMAEDDSYILVLTATDLAGNTGVIKTADSVRFDTSKTELLLTMSDTAFSPNGNRVKDTITFIPVTSTKDVESYSFVISDAKGKAVYKSEGTKRLPVEFVWDGKGDDKIICADGLFTAKLTVEAVNHSIAEASTQSFELDTVFPSLDAEIPWAAFSPDGDGNQDNIPVTIKASTSEKLWTAEVRNSKDKAVKKYTWSNTADKFTWDGTDESGNVAVDGTYSIIIYSTDDAGNNFSTELKGITLDNRETKAYITAEYEGISPNGDGYLEGQKFEIKTSVADSIKTWNFSVVREDGTAVYTLTEKDSANLPANIVWNGVGKDGKVAEGTFIGTLAIDYAKGNKVSVVSSPFICTATAPQLKVQTAPEYFSPDNDGVDDDLYIRLTGTTKAKIASWSFVINDPKGKAFWKTSGKSAITERIIWDGLSNCQKAANGSAERVQSAMDYPYEFTVKDNLGMTSTVKGNISVDVLVIRDGNVLKMAVPSIIFESDSDNFQTANSKLTQEQINKNIATLNRIADILKKFKDYKVEIVGHANKLTDNPDEETVDNPRNWGRALTPLSKERADAIKAYLVKRGVAAANISTNGKGGTQPVADPTDKDNNWKNRRVEFILVK